MLQPNHKHPRLPACLQNTDIEPKDYLHKVLYLGDGSSCGGPAVALGMQNCAPGGSCLVWMHNKHKSPFLVAHELGHNVGLFHGMVAGERAMGTHVCMADNDYAKTEGDAMHTSADACC